MPMKRGISLDLPVRRKHCPRPPTWGRARAVLAGDGAIAQLGERLVRNEEVSGSIPLGSTIPLPDTWFVTKFYKSGWMVVLL